MLLRLLRAAFALLVALVLASWPALTLASPATASPPLLVVGLVPESPQARESSGLLMWTDYDAYTGLMCTTASTAAHSPELAPTYPLRE